MKKITYLVAPLMVLPFLVGCNKGGKTHVVYISDLSSDRIVFTDKSGKEINATNPVQATEGQDFVFTVSAKQSNLDVPYEVNKDYVYAFSGEEATPLAMKFEQSETDKSTAKCTIAGKDITADIALAGVEYLADYYLVDFPYLLGTKVFIEECKTDSKSGKKIICEPGASYGYAPTDGNLTIDFTIDWESEYAEVPSAENIVMTRDLGDVEQPTKDCTWATYEVGYIGNGHLTIKEGAVQSSLFISARSCSSSLIEDMSWSEIAKVAETGAADELFEYGETKHITINGKKHAVKIIGFNHDDKTDNSGKAGITFQFSTVVSDSEGNAIECKWTDSGNNHDFETSTLNTKLTSGENSVLNMLPDDLKEVMKEVTKKVGICDSSDNWTAGSYQTKLFPLASVEVNNEEGSSAIEGEGEQYGYYEKFSEYYPYSQLRRASDANGTHVGYWLRSPSDKGSDKNAYRIDSAGSLSTQSCTNEYGILPAFCI